MAAPLGNQFWKQRSTHGRNPIFATPEDLWNACEQYFEAIDANPLHEAQAFAYQGTVKQEALPKMRAMTIGGLCIFLDIDQTTWRTYADKEGFSSVVTRVEAVIRDQKFSGAAAGLLNANIIARDLGLAEKQEHGGPDGGPIVMEVDDKKLARSLALILAKGIKAKPGA